MSHQILAWAVCRGKPQRPTTNHQPLITDCQLPSIRKANSTTRLGT
ncbi:MAG: hypothetical protein GX325_05990 [Peptococcaceae bacterium]|nr:hypothetical protein [Peptococcaceae bacterium]